MRSRLNGFWLGVVLCAVGGAFWLHYRIEPNSAQPKAAHTASPTNRNRISADIASQVIAIERTERIADRTVWAKEILAEQCGRSFENLWDSINSATNKLATLASFPFGELILSEWKSAKLMPHGVEFFEPETNRTTLTPNGWRALIAEKGAAAWQLNAIEFRHNQFDLDTNGKPQRSQLYFSAHLVNERTFERAIVEGDLTVEWGEKLAGTEGYAVRRLDASQLTIKRRKGSPPFQPILSEQIAPIENSYSIDPLIVYDLDGDGLSEIILAGKNVVYHRGADGSFQSTPLCRFPPGVVYAAIVGDFDGDGNADYLCEKYEGLVLYRGSSRGTFDEPGKIVWRAPSDMKYPMVLTCGDIDHDGDLDLFVAQYNVPYEGGSMPTPFFDANDGNPSYLLLNDGHGNFTNATARAGFTRKRWRRTYSASFVDFDGDGHLDLSVVSDFAGVDLYRNDGRGQFEDVTTQWIAEPHAFGMAQAWADFNLDGRTDFLMIGMASPTVNRLEHLKIWRSDNLKNRSMRPKMVAGNRLYLSTPGGPGLAQNSMSESIAHSGWSWGCSAFDVDNDGYPDVYIANGLESRRSVRDYETEYWLHDRFVGSSKPSKPVYEYFKAKFARTRGAGQSYGGYEKNRLFLNQKGNSFFEAAHLFGVGIEQDSRNVVTDDLDGDGRVDLIVTSFEAWPEAKQTLRIYRNNLEGGGNWIGFRFREEGNGVSPIGVSVNLNFADGHSTLRQIVTGDSYRSQHSSTIHFGLGQIEALENAEIRWVGGKTATLNKPALNKYYNLRVPKN